MVLRVDFDLTGGQKSVNAALNVNALCAFIWKMSYRISRGVTRTSESD